MKYVKVNKTGQRWEIRLHRPERRNAFHPQMISELTQAFSEASRQGPESLRVLLLSGEGASFCAGADLEWMKSMVDYSHEENLTDSQKLFDLFWAARNCPVPVVAQVQGHVMGGALGLLAISDVVLAETNTQMAFSEVRLGLVPAVISPFVLEKLQPHRAQEWMLTGQIFSAQEAQEAGLVHFVGSAQEVREAVEAKLSQLEQVAPEASRTTKELLLRLREGGGFADWRSLCPQVIADRRVSAEGQEGLKAFLAKRQPHWLGGQK